MGVPGSSAPLLFAPTEQPAGYSIERSLRFNSSDSGFLSRVPSSAGNRKTWTLSLWVKRTSLGSTQMFFGTTGTTDATYSECFFTSADKLEIALGYTTVARIRTTQVFRDPSAWQHILIAHDNTQATAANRIRLYVNGSEVTAFDVDTRSTFSNTDLGINSTQTHYIGIGPNSSSNFLNAYLADCFLIDGQQLTPSSFGEPDDNGVWQPIEYTGSYNVGVGAVNGFHLPFSDNSTAAALGKDVSGLGNNWTPNNLSVTAGAGNDSLVDSPTNYGTDTGVGGEVRGNYCTWNPLKKGAAITDLTNGNLDWLSTTVGSNYTSMILGTIGVSSGKWYWENTIGSLLYVGVGIATDQVNLNTYPGGDAYSWTYFYNAAKYNNGSSSAYGASFTTGDVIGVALDLDTGSLTFYKNGVSQGVAYSGLSGPTYFPMSGDPNSSTNGSIAANFGQRPFAYTAPSGGFKALCTANLPTPVIANGATAMDVKLYTGNGSTQTISGLNFSPDFLWIKTRNAAYNHHVYDSVRGVDKFLRANTTESEYTVSPLDQVTSFNSDGFSLGADNASPGAFEVNELNKTYAAWCWDAGTTTSSNGSGSITSSVRASASSGFSVVTFTAPSSGSATIGHGLGVEPYMIIIKSRDQTYNWCVYHKSLTSNAYFLNLNTTAAQSTTSNVWNNTTPTSTVFSLGSGYAGAGATVAYVFSPVSGYTAMGSYTGDGSTSGFGPFIHCGFRPKFVLIKGSSVAHDWLMFDSVRNPYNLTTQVLYANSSTAEMTNNGTGSGGYESIDILSNGFQIKSNSSRYNQSSATYIYFAVAESPFAYARAR